MSPRDTFLEHYYYPETANKTAEHAYVMAVIKWVEDKQMDAPFKDKESVRLYIHNKRKKSTH